VLGGVVAEPAGNLGEDLRAGVHEHPALRHVAEPRIVAERVVHELGQLGERLHACVARADEDERQVALGVAGVRIRVVELAQHVVPELDRVGHVLEGKAVLGEPRDREHPRDRTQRDDEPLVLDLEPSELALDGDRACTLVERDGAAADDVRMRTHDPQRDDDVTGLDRAGCHLGQQRRVEHRALGADMVAPALPSRRATYAPPKPPPRTSVPPRATRRPFEFAFMLPPPNR
jgi:hypothetical protein